MTRNPAQEGRMIGYARVSTGEQSTASQAAELRAAGCVSVHEEHGSGGSRARPVLNRLVEQVGAGDTLVVIRIDRLARSLSHLLEVIEGLEAKGAFFRSLRDPIDTASPQGKLTLQILGATAEFERALIRERTVAGLDSARAAGRVGGNPALQSGDRAVLRKMARSREEAYFLKLEASSDTWLPVVRQLRPRLTWEDVTAQVNMRIPDRKDHWTTARLKRAAKFYVREGLLGESVLERSPPRSSGDRLMAIVAAIAGARSDVTLKEIAERLEQMRERTPRGSLRWQISTVKMLRDRAREHGLLDRG